MRLLLVLLFPLFAMGSEYIHPGVRAAMEDTDTSDDFIVIDGVKYPTGYHPTLEQYEGARFLRVKPRTATIPKEFSLRALSFSPVRRQVNGDCWAQGAISAFQMTVNFLDKTQKLFSVQDIIDCSGFGTARNGGQLSMKHLLKGAVLVTHYPYTGTDDRCRTDVPRDVKPQTVFFGRGSGGGLPTLPELQTMVLDNLALEVCGASSALGKGGRVDDVRTGRIDHCYALTGWIDGAARSWLPHTYLEFENSWGEGWGEKGYAYIPLAKGDGVHLKGSVIAEIQGTFYKPRTPKEPVEFTVESQSVVLRAVVQPETDYSVEDAKAALEAAIQTLGE